MTSDAGVWVIASLMVVAALVVALFWIIWFREEHDQDWLPAGYVEHEAPFVWTDIPLAVLLVVSAVLLVVEEPLGERLALVAAGMLAFLGILDTAYFWRTGLFARDRDGLANLGVVTGVLLLSGILLVRFL
ncbi:MAG: hypothetical protein MUP76_05720 [Acidimicrobiia bacterium]|nr:hypothetical protein [Acidimicrobiia bacterium]